ncbi:MAG: hypothetical protein IJ200_03965 [Prevotella sp.]|nr:hypothetical protein [Prevotella sp.]
MNKMAKKLILALFLLLEGTNYSFCDVVCGSPIILQPAIVQPTSTNGGYPRIPTAVPQINQDGHTLFFNNVGYDLTLVLLDDEEDEVYAAIIPAGTMTVTLPSSLSGTYELQLYPGGNYYFFSDIYI